MSKEKSKEIETKKKTPYGLLLSPSPMEREMSRRYRDLFGEPWFTFDWPKELRNRRDGFDLQMPPIEIYQEEKDVVVKAEVPGMQKEDLEISLYGDILTIKGEKKTKNEEKKKGYYYSEWSYGSFERSIVIPEKVLPDKIRASFKDGVLEVRLEKSEEAKRKGMKIKIE